MQIRPVVNITQEITVSAPAVLSANPYYWSDGEPDGVDSGGVGEDTGTSDSASASESSSDSASSSSSDGSGESSSSGDSW